MTQTIKLLAGFTNNFHDFLNALISSMGFQLTDKQMHFFVIGIIGIILFFITNLIFKRVAKYSIEAISFIYTLTVMVVFVFAIEIEQKITGKGRMEFSDITAGLWGFIYAFSIYLLYRIIVFTIKYIMKQHTLKKEVKASERIKQ
jgi:O-antigen/teichoic acid export membrane protein